MESDTLSKQKKTTLTTFLALLLATLAINLSMVQPYLLSVLMGGILSLLSYRFYQRLRSKRVSPKIAAGLVTLALTLLVIGPLSGFISLMVQQAISLTESLSKNGSYSLQAVFNKLNQWPIMKRFIPDSQSFDHQLTGWLQTGGKAATSVALSTAANLPAILLQLALAMISCFFLLIDGRRFLHWTLDKLPLDREVRSNLFGSFQNTAISVIWATLAAAGAQSAVILFSFLVLQVPLAFLAAGATFVLAWIPMVGSVPVWAGATVYLYLQGMMTKTVLMLIFGLITGVVDNFVRPWVLKGRGEMHPLVSLVAIFGGIDMFGITGVFVGPILAAVLISLLQTWPHVGERFGLLSPARTELKINPSFDPMKDNRTASAS